MSSGTDQRLYEPPMLRFAIQGRSYMGVMDTGSTGVMVSASTLPGYTPNPCQGTSNFTGWEFLSSSKRLWVGHWIPQEINFLDASGAVLATAKVPVLASSATRWELLQNRSPASVSLPDFQQQDQAPAELR